MANWATNSQSLRESQTSIYWSCVSELIVFNRCFALAHEGILEIKFQMLCSTYYVFQSSIISCVSRWSTTSPPLHEGLWMMAQWWRCLLNTEQKNKSNRKEVHRFSEGVQRHLQHGLIKLRTEEHSLNHKSGVYDVKILPERKCGRITMMCGHP